MLDLSKFTDAMTAFFGAAATSATEASGPGALLDLLSSAGIDPSILADLSDSQIGEVLAQHGIDVSQLGGDQIRALFETFGLGEREP